MIEKELDYKSDRLHIFFTSLLSKIGNEYLREEKELVYELSTINDNCLVNWKNRGVTVECNINNLLEVLDETYNLLHSYYKTFLNSEDGRIWLENIISYYIFRRNQNFNSFYAENLGVDILNEEYNSYIFDYRKAKSEAIKLTTDDLLEFSKKQLEIDPVFWFVSPHKDEEVYSIFRKSKFYKKYYTPTN